MDSIKNPRSEERAGIRASGTLILRGSPPIGDIPIVFERVRVSHNIAQASVDHQNIDSSVEGDEIDLRGQALEETVVVLHASRKLHAIAALSQRLVDDRVLDTAIVAKIGVRFVGNLRGMEHSILVVRLRGVGIAEHGQVVCAGSQNASASIHAKKLPQGIEGQRYLNTDRAQILLDAPGNGGSQGIA